MTDKNRAPEPDDLEDDFELELEPVDPEIEEHKRRRVIQKTRAAEDSVDLDQLYEETNTGEPADPIDLKKFKNFRFSIQHLLVATALLSIVMAVGQLTSGCTAVTITIAATVAAGWWYVLRQERQQRAQKKAELAKFKARIITQRAQQDGQPASSPAARDAPIAETTPSPKFDFAFSLKEMFGVFTFAAMVFGLVEVVGGPHNVAMLLGLVALSGLVLTAAGLDPPRIVVLGWWLLLMLYLFVSGWAALSSDQAAMPRPSENTPIAARFQTPDQFSLNEARSG